MKTSRRSPFRVLSRRLLKLQASLGEWKPRPPRRLSPIERRRVAYYEVGQALVASALSDVERVGSLSFRERKSRGGVTLSSTFVTRAELEVQLAVLLGGRAAEEVAFAQVSTGAADDLRVATEIARRMVTIYGMESGLGPVAYENLHPTPLPECGPHSEQTQREIDESIRDILTDALNRSIRVLRVNRKVLDDAAKQLMEKERLTEADLAEFFRRMKPLEAVLEKNLHGSPLAKS